MLTIKIQVKAPPSSAQGIKEDIATILERYGDCKVLSITEDKPEQLKIKYYMEEKT